MRKTIQVDPRIVTANYDITSYAFSEGMYNPFRNVDKLYPEYLAIEEQKHYVSYNYEDGTRSQPFLYKEFADVYTKNGELSFPELDDSLLVDIDFNNTLLDKKGTYVFNSAPGATYSEGRRDGTKSYIAKANFILSTTVGSAIDVSDGCTFSFWYKNVSTPRNLFSLELGGVQNIIKINDSRDWVQNYFLYYFKGQHSTLSLITMGEWVNITFTIDLSAGILRLYRNGIFVNETITVPSDTPTETILKLGVNDGIDAELYKIQDLKIYNRVFDDIDVMKIYYI